MGLWRDGINLEAAEIKKSILDINHAYIQGWH